MINDELIGMEISECKENVIRSIIDMQSNCNDGIINLEKLIVIILDNAILAYDDGTVIDVADVLAVVDKMVGEGELDLSDTDMDKEFTDMMIHFKSLSWIPNRPNGCIYMSDYYCNKNVIQKIIKTGKELKHIKNPVTLRNVSRFRIERTSSSSSDYISLLTYALILEEDASKEEFERIFKECNRRLIRISEEGNSSIYAHTIKNGLKNMLSYIITLGDKDKYMHVIMKTLNGLFTNCKASISRKTGIRNFIQETDTNIEVCTKMYEQMKRYNDEVEEFPFFKNFSKYYNLAITEALL